jgi:hypothetical protein
MATTYHVLGQANPTATTLTTLYTVPSATQAVVSTIVVTNQTSSAGTYRISVRVGGASDTTKQYLAYDVSLPGNASDTLTLGITLTATDVISVYTSSGSFSFNAFGSEIA